MFNIITPTYNRAHTLKRVLDSLLAQTEMDFNWIIIDDASTDNTCLCVEEWQIQYPQLRLEYYKLPENKGKSYAVNYGLQYCTRKITIIADSDDGFVAHTLADLKELWNQIDQSPDSERIASIWTLSKNENGELIGNPFPKDNWQVGLKDRILKHKIKGEKWHSWRSDILKQYKMYVSEISHISESATWNKINQDYDFLCVNRAHRCYYDSPDGMMATKKTRRQLAPSHFFTSYYELSNAKLGNLFKYRHYRYQSFDHIRSKFHFNDKNYKLPLSKQIISILIFLFVLPIRLLKRFL